MLEAAGSVDEAVAWLETARRTMPQNYALADPRGARVVESGADRFQIRPVLAGLAVITNFWDEAQGGAKDGRYAGMLRAAGDGKLGPAELQRILAGAALGELNVQSVILEPQRRAAHVAHGKPPVAAGSWRTLELGAWLGSDPENPLTGPSPRPSP